MGNLEIYEKVRTVPQEAQKRINGGRMNGKTDINPMWRIKVLTELFGPCGVGWYYKPVRKWTETIGSETAAFVDIELYVKLDGEWSMPISGTGGNMLAAKEKSGIYVSDECYKMATTDAISVACKQLGIGSDIYWSADRTKYDGQRGGECDGKTEKREPQRQRKPQLVTEAMIKALCKEMDRTGTSIEKVLSVVKKQEVEQITAEEYVKLMKKFEKTPDAPPIDNGPAPPPPDIPDDYEGLPFA